MSERTRSIWFSPHPGAWILAVVLGVFAHEALLAFPIVGWTRDESFLLVAACGGLAGAWALTALLWLFSEGERLFYHFIFVGVWAAFLAGGYIYARDLQVARDTVLVEQQNANRLALRQAAVERAKAARERAQRELSERQQRIADGDRFARYEGLVPDETLDRMRAADEEILEGLRAAAERYKSTLAANEVGGPSEWLRVATLDGLEAMRARNQAVYEASRAYNDYLAGLEERYQAQLDELALVPPADRYAIAEMERLLQFWEYSGASEIRRLDSEVSAIALRALDLLRDRWGNWQFDRANSRVTFDDPNDEFQFAQLLQEAEMILRRQRELERQQDAYERAAG